MTPILYFEAFALALVLLVSATAAAVWTISKLLDAFVRAYLWITQPETRAAKRLVRDPNPHQLKRAGQW